MVLSPGLPRPVRPLQHIGETDVIDLFVTPCQEILDDLVGGFFDGAIGTELYRHHVFTNRCFEEQNLVAPNLVRQIHSSYLEAGADIVETNTFNGNAPALADYELEAHVTELNFAAGYGLIGERDILGVLISWGESLLAAGQEAVNKDRRGDIKFALDLFAVINTGGGGGVDE